MNKTKVIGKAGGYPLYWDGYEYSLGTYPFYFIAYVRGWFHVKLHPWRAVRFEKLEGKL